MPLFKEHVAVGQNYDCGGNNNGNCFYAFCVLGHGNFFLHEVYEQVEDATKPRLLQRRWHKIF